MSWFAALRMAVLWPIRQNVAVQPGGPGPWFQKSQRKCNRKANRDEGIPPTAGNGNHWRNIRLSQKARKCNSRALRARSARSARSFHIFKFQNPHTFSQIFDWRYLRGTPFFQKIGRQRKYHEKTFWVRRFVRAVPLLGSWRDSGISVSGPFVLKFSGLPSGLARWVSFGTPFSKSLGDTW